MAIHHKANIGDWHRDRNRFIVRADEKLTTFLEGIQPIAAALEAGLM
jgi:hypothetical protein